MPETIKSSFSVALTPNDFLRWRRRCQRKDVRHTTAVREIVLETMKDEKEPQIKAGTNVKAELAKLKA